jgi:hypothetical protein
MTDKKEVWYNDVLIFSHNLCVKNWKHSPIVLLRQMILRIQDPEIPPTSQDVENFRRELFRKAMDHSPINLTKILNSTSLDKNFITA